MAAVLSDGAWGDLTARRRRDGVYAVVSTGIYCRFGCVARLPLRVNVREFAAAADAEAAGFRACKRCHPKTACMPEQSILGR